MNKQIQTDYAMMWDGIIATGYGRCLQCGAIAVTVQPRPRSKGYRLVCVRCNWTENENA